MTRCPNNRCTVVFVKRDGYGDGIYRCTKCNTRYSELSAYHYGLIGPGQQLKDIIKGK